MDNQLKQAHILKPCLGPALSSADTAAGFTLIELVVVVLIVGVLAISAVPSLLSKNIFDSRGFSDQVGAGLRYAQKAAISQRRSVCVTFTANSMTLKVATSASSASCTGNLAGPTGSSPYQVSNASVTFSATPTNFQFNALGQASIAQTISITGAAGAITIERDTGYVHP